MKYSLTIIGKYASSIHKRGSKSARNATNRPENRRESVRARKNCKKSHFSAYNGEHFRVSPHSFPPSPVPPGFLNERGVPLAFAKPNIKHCFMSFEAQCHLGRRLFLNIHVRPRAHETFKELSAFLPQRTVWPRRGKALLHNGCSLRTDNFECCWAKVLDVLWRY